ncbi:MipA/OmpV family protein [Paraburkholderia sp. 22B1P]|uniref:MipA/OmpV family protein n=1 Tax=Paraburkholderia sp. 22B1P TaxID=3080498 RepID=UPI00308CE5FF|nr:MipA/OmpV family protein [Paraburkholderia sp. 22B1P]
MSLQRYVIYRASVGASSRPRIRPSGVAAALGALGFLMVSASAVAQETPRNNVGLNLSVFPRYQGASTYRVLPLPVLALSSHGLPYGGSFFLEDLNGGVAFPFGRSATVGLLVGVGLGRKQDDAPILNGLGDIDTSFQYGLFARWHRGPASADVRFLQSAHMGYGNHVTLGVSYAVFDVPRDRVTVSADTVWSNGPAQQTYFGVDSEQAANSTAGLPVYHPSAGFSRVDGRLAWEHRLNSHWSWRSSIGVGSLLGDAANSPVVEHRAALFGSAGASYHF